MTHIPFSISTNTDSGEPQENNYWMARLSRIAYRDLPGIINETKILWGNPKVLFFENKSTDTQVCILEYENDKALVAFRGTEMTKIKDWISDFYFVKKKYRGHRIHGGFLGSLESIIDIPRTAYGYRDAKEIATGQKTAVKFGEKIAQYAADNIPILITGHSLGGALAAVAGLYFKLKYGLVAKGIYTYGQPKICGKPLVDYYYSNVTDKLFINVNDEDIVPKVPLAKMGFKHFTVNYPYDAKGDEITDPDLRKKIQNRVDKGISALTHIKEGVGDHNIVNYIFNQEKKWY